MRFMMFMYPSEKAEQGAMPEAEAVGEMMKYNEALAKAGVLLALDGLHPTSKAARITWNAQGKPTVTDGPFTEVKEVVGGYWIIQVKSREEAIEWAKRVPARDARKIELRQIFEMTDFPADVQKVAESPAGRATIERIEKASRS
jgi:hypothetical protein